MFKRDRMGEKFGDIKMVNKVEKILKCLNCGKTDTEIIAFNNGINNGSFRIRIRCKYCLKPRNLLPESYSEKEMVNEKK